MLINFLSLLSLLLVYPLALLGAYRVAHAITLEDGPFDIFASMRDEIGQATWIGRGFHCTNCVSVWVSLAMTEWFFLLGLIPVGYSLIFWLGLAGGALVLHLYLYGNA